MFFVTVFRVFWGRRFIDCYRFGTDLGSAGDVFRMVCTLHVADVVHVVCCDPAWGAPRCNFIIFVDHSPPSAYPCKTQNVGLVRLYRPRGNFQKLQAARRAARSHWRPPLCRFIGSVFTPGLAQRHLRVASKTNKQVSQTGSAVGHGHPRSGPQ